MGIVKKASATDQIVDYILGQIQSKDLKPNDQLMNERAFSETLGVSRVPLREAISALSILGVVEARQGVGTFVSHYDPSMLAKVMRIYAILDNVPMSDIFETRAIIESQATRIAAEHASAEELGELERCLTENKQLLARIDHLYRNADAGQRLFDRFNQFHTSVAKCSHNKFMRQFMDSIRLLSQDYLMTGIQSNPDILDGLRDADRQHEEIYRLICARDGEGAAQAMYRHLIDESRSIQSLIPTT